MPHDPISLVIPARDEAGNVGPLMAEIAGVLDAASIPWEAIVVDDGSTDGTAAEIAAAAVADPRVRPLRFERPRGKSAAIERGIATAAHATIVMLDGDGQDDPAEIPKLLSRLDEGAGLANGWKHPRHDPWRKTFPSRVFNLIVGMFTGLPLHDHNCGLKAFRAEVFRGVPLPEGMHRFLPVLAASRGHRVVEVPVHHRPRVRGRTKYGPSRFVSGLVDLVRFTADLPRIGRDGTVGRLVAFRHAPGEPTAALRRAVVGMLCTIACFMAAGRLASVASVDKLALEKRLVDDLVKREQSAGRTIERAEAADRIRRDKRLLRPFLSANDRSRWLTARALVEKGTFAIDELVVEPGWDTIDAVAHADASGRLRLYSSKPPLLSVLVAGPYWLVHRLTGWTLADHPFTIGRSLMVLFGLVPFAAMVLASARLAERVGTTDWGRLYAAAFIAFGTFLLTFTTVLNNHLPAAACTAISAIAVWRIWMEGERSAVAFLSAGFFSSLAAAFDLPAAAWTAVAFAACLACDPRKTISVFLPSAAIVAAAAIGTNRLAHGTWLPAYAHRHGPDSWYRYKIELPNGRVLTSYWENPSGVDRGEPSPARYAFHALVGHHGIFSLTPAWLLVPGGLAVLAGRGDRRLRLAAAAVAAVSVAVLAFYLTRSQPDRNYGGTASGFRWAFWLAPLWAAAVAAAADRLSTTRAGRVVAFLLLGLSVFSVAYPAWNPWTHPWPYAWMESAGWTGP